MKAPDKIIACERAYSEFISSREELPTIVRYRDELIPDMFDYNFDYIKDGAKPEDIPGIVSEIIDYRRQEGADFCHIIMDFPLSDETCAALPKGMEQGITGYYVFDISKLSEMKAVEGISLKAVNNPKRGNDIYKIDFEIDGGRLDSDFIRRKDERRTSIYTSDGPINCFVCYYGDEPIGSCDLMIKNGCAKIEEFCVIPSMQRKGFGTAILRELIDRADICGADTIYLCTDEDDTAKEMYNKVGFNKVGERSDLFMKLQ